MSRRLLKEYSGPATMWRMILHVEGLRWHDPDHAYARCPVVGAPSHSYGYGVVAPPRSWNRGIRNAAHCTPSTAFRGIGPPGWIVFVIKSPPVLRRLVSF